MATRRPKVPKVAPSRAAKEAPEGADVILADFGPGKDTTAGDAAGAQPAGAQPAGTPAGRRDQASRKGPEQARRKGSSATDGKAGPAAPADDEDQQPVPAKAFSGRMLALAVVMIAITILLAPTVKIFLEKRAEISALEAEIAGRKAEQTELNKQLSRWQDPNYVKQQARDRINMVMPGETGYWVFGGEEAAGTPGGRTGSGSSANPENLPWVDALWESIRRSATD